MDLSTAKVAQSVVVCTHLVKVHIALVTRRHPTYPRTCLHRRLSLHTTALTLLLNKICIHPSFLARVRRPHNNILMKDIPTLALARDRIMERLNKIFNDFLWTCVIFYDLFCYKKKPLANSRRGLFFCSHLNPSYVLLSAIYLTRLGTILVFCFLFSFRHSVDRFPLFTFVFLTIVSFGIYFPLTHT